MIQVSVIIPTLNRAFFLKNTLLSTLNQSFPQDEYEIILIDNGSTDNTKQVVEDLNHLNNNRIRYFYDARPGLHIGRHLGAKHARGDILLYGDDDIIASPDWVKEIYFCYSKKEVGGAGGKILPKFETTPPEWLNIFHRGYLSLLDLGDKSFEMTTNEIYGCNLSIKKDILFKLGGFHPDAMPQNLIKYRGDGESALISRAMEAGYKTIHNPKAYVYHVIPSSRITIEYFKRRAFNQGISDSFSLIRKYGKIEDDVFEKRLRSPTIIRRFFNTLWFMKNGNIKFLKFHNEVRNAYLEGIKYHINEVKCDPKLLEYVLKENYLL
jgi:glycosyltransferase involved in cell wall biosynthesis